jgi:hypothetical protein
LAQSNIDILILNNHNSLEKNGGMGEWGNGIGRMGEWEK